MKPTKKKLNKEFWNHMNSGINYGSILVGESYGLKYLIENKDVKEEYACNNRKKRKIIQRFW